MQTWKLQYGKTYTRNYGDSMGGKYSQEESFRMKIWMENKAKIEKHNRHFYKVSTAIGCDRIPFN